MDVTIEGPLHLFEGYGIELEYMIVRRDDLAVLPVSDEVLKAVTGEYASDFEEGPVAWSNELVLHVIELKTNGPTPSLAGWGARFRADLRRIEEILAPLGGMLLPTGMHPTMRPLEETRLWPHENSPIYEAYNRIFDCRGHGWSNLQSCHLNLPFQGDAEFGRLHAAIRAVLPLLPALAASSPLMDGLATGVLDNRLEVYRFNQRRIPAITGLVVPEPVFTEAAYREQVLGRIYQDVAPHDPAGVVQREFLNSRGAIARFERSAIEIRVLDVQETPAADLAIARLVTETLRALCAERFVGMDELMGLATEPLAELLLQTIRTGEATPVAHAPLLAALGVAGGSPAVGDVWRRLAAALPRGDADPELDAARDVILEHGPLSRRILRALGAAPGRTDVDRVYRELGACLTEGRPFVA